ncbi:MAG: serine/threonine protein kinase, partial [Chloroflexota bacterium]|nr:serine/threonine protein kinase [Chloroflexota bacterium]
MVVGVLPPGTRLNGGSFSIGRVLGRGGFGITYLGADLRLKRRLAVKEFFPAGSSRKGTSVVLAGALSRPDYEAAIQKFEQEAQMVARFRHRSIVNVYEVFEENDTAYMAMEYLEGENFLERMERRGGPLSESELVAINGPLAEALAEVHAAGVLHRDIKPQNIMLVGPDDTPRPVLIDFGAAREFASGMAARHSIMLTPGYAPLEQYGEQARRGPFTDIYALAATLYHIATGEQPPAATERVLGVALKPPRAVNSALSSHFEAALLHGLEMKVDERPQTALAFHHELAGGAPASRPRVPNPSSIPGRSSSPQASPSRSTPMPPPPPARTPSIPVGHLERVRQIARALRPAVQVRPDGLVCPVCRSAGMLDSARTVAGIRCPICRDAVLQERFSSGGPLLCPSCSTGELEPLGGDLVRPGVLMRCPACRTGNVMQYVRSQMLLVPDVWAQCDHCDADFDYHTGYDTLTLTKLPSGPGHLNSSAVGQTRARGEWALIAGGGSADAFLCGVCEAEFHSCRDGGLEWVARGGSRTQVPAEHRGQCWSRPLWQKIAHKVSVNSGNVACPNCAAQFDETAPGQLTLLDASRDPFGALAAHRGRTYPVSTWRTLGVGDHAAARPGLVCPVCTAELQEEGGADEYSLVTYDPDQDPRGTGGRYHKQRLSRRAWQRIAAGTMPAREEARLRDEAHRELWAALCVGEISPAEGTYPGQKSRDENVVVTFAAAQIRSRLGFHYEYDSGQIWLTTERLLYHGERSSEEILLAETGGCELEDVMQGYGAVVTI